MQTTETFGVMLRRLRMNAGLTRERLAEVSAICRRIDPELVITLAGSD